MKKTLIVIIVLLIILAIGQSIYYNIRKSDVSPDILPENIVEGEVTGKKESIYINGMLNLYNEYEPKISSENLQKEFYNLLYRTFPEIAESAINLSENKIKDYYNKNKDKINEMHILSEEEFYMIVTQLKDISEEELLLTEYRIDKESIKKLDDDKISFDITFTYDNGIEVIIGCKISESNDQIEFYSHSELDKVFEQYEGNVTRQELIEQINYFIKNVRNIRDASSLKSENQKRQYFDTKSEDLKKYGIITQDDFINIAREINLLNWRHSDLAFQYYSVNSDTYTGDVYYNYFEMVLNYNYYGKINLKVGLSRNNNVDPSIKISIFENESEQENG